MSSTALSSLPASPRTEQLANSLLTFGPVYEFQHRAALAAIRFAREHPWKAAAVVAVTTVVWILWKQESEQAVRHA
jgi:hypothetical protein